MTHRMVHLQVGSAAPKATIRGVASSVCGRASADGPRRCFLHWLRESVLEEDQDRYLLIVEVADIEERRELELQSDLVRRRPLGADTAHASSAGLAIMASHNP